jgi:MFS family permease
MNRDAMPSLIATTMVQILASMTMFGVSVIAPVAALDIGVPATLIGVFTSIAFGSGMLAGLLTGAFADRFGAIRICQLTMASAFVGVALLTLSTPAAALASAVFLGLCYGPINPVCTHILARVAPERRRPLFFSIKQSGQPAGVAISGVLLPPLVLLYDWRAAIFVTGVLACVAALCIQPLRPRLDAVRNANRPIHIGSVIEPLKLVWLESRLRCLALSGFILSGCQVSLSTFYVVYLTAAMAMPLTTAGLMYTVMQVGAVLGRLFWGAVADRFISGHLVLVGLGLANGVISVVAGLFAPDWNIWIIGLVSFMLGATSHGWNGVFFSELVKYAPAARTGEAASGIQFATLAGVVVVPSLFGVIVAVSGGYFIAFAAVACAATIAAAYIKLRLR